MTHPSKQSGAFPSASHRAALLEELRWSFALDWHGIHGVCHWSRVWTNGRRLAPVEGNLDFGVLELFAWFHDSCRWGEGRDSEHGPRAALHARELRGEFFELEDARLDLLAQGCTGHTRSHPGLFGRTRRLVSAIGVGPLGRTTVGTIGRSVTLMGGHGWEAAIGEFERANSKGIPFQARAELERLIAFCIESGENAGLERFLRRQVSGQK